MDLEGDVEVAEAERDGLRLLRAEVEDAVITLARRVGRLREELDFLVHAIAS